MKGKLKAVPSPAKSELQKFASWFHQDWQLFYESFDEGAGMYLQDLPEDRKHILKAELTQFLPSANRRSWLKLGAQAADRDVQTMLQRFLQMMV